MFDAYEQEYNDKSYTLFTDDLNTEYRLFSQLQSEYDTVAAYSDFLEGVQTKATQLSGISIFQNDRTGYDLEKHRTDRTGLCRTDRYAYRVLPAKGLVHGHQLCIHGSYPVGGYAAACADSCTPRARQRFVEPDSQLTRWTVKNGHCKAGGICCQLIGRSDGAVWGQSRILFGIVQPWTHEPHNSKCSGFDALYHADYRWAVSFSIFTCKVGRCVCDGAVGYAGCPYRQTRCRRVGWRLGPALGNVRHSYCNTCHESLERCKICEYGEPAADQRAAGELPESFLVW